MRQEGSVITGSLRVRSVLPQYEMNEQYMKLAHLIAELMQKNYYGSLDVKFEAGKITVCKKTESIRI